MQVLCDQLKTNRDLLLNPEPQRVIHQHHLGKLFWLSASLFLLQTFAFVGWYKTKTTLANYQENDIKYRYLKQKGNLALTKLLCGVDSLLRTGYAMNDSVTTWEAEEQKTFELSKKLRLKSDESGELQGELELLKNRSKQRKQSK